MSHRALRSRPDSGSLGRHKATRASMSICDSVCTKLTAPIRWTCWQAFERNIFDDVGGYVVADGCSPSEENVTERCKGAKVKRHAGPSVLDFRSDGSGVGERR
jgi:hypothetical protein